MRGDGVDNLFNLAGKSSNMKQLVLFAATALAVTACSESRVSTYNNPQQTGMQYPETRKDQTVDEYFGVKVADPYRWLEDDRSEETAQWVKAQNQLTQSYLSKIPYREAIGNRYRDLYNYEKISAPNTQGEYIYYSRNSGLQNHSVVYRKKKSGGEATVFLDPNTFSVDGTTSLAGMHFTESGNLLAYSISEGGSDWRKVILMNAHTGVKMDDTLKDIKFSGASWKGEEGLYYSTYKRDVESSMLSGFTNQHMLYYHKLGTAQKDDQLIFGDAANPRRYVGGRVTENQRWLIITASNATYGNELMIKDLTKPGAPIQTIVGDMKNKHSVLHADDRYFYIYTDRNAPNSKVVRAPIDHPQESNWEDLIPETTEVLNANIAGKYIFAVYLKDAYSKVKQYDFSGKHIRDIQLPGVGSAYGFSEKTSATVLYYGYMSFTSPYTIYKLDIETGTSTLYIKPDVQFNPDAYESKQVFYPSKDGTKIPMFIIHRKGLDLNGKNPTLLYGYGGFDVSLTPTFSVSNVILLEQGGVLAIANLRGGGEYGKSWHKAGTKTQKQNVFDDFIAAAEYLKKEKYTSTDYLALNGGSNGGLLVGAVMTQQPDICKVAAPEVGVLDMLRYHKFTSGAGWAYDYGTSEESKEMFEYLLGYSPLHNLKPAQYPATMVFTADHDDRVVPAHSFKFAATLQQAQRGNLPTLIRVETKAGHGAGMSTQQIVDEQKDFWSFIFYNMGITPTY